MGNDLRTALSNAMSSGKLETPATPAPAPATTPAAPAASTAPASPGMARDEAGRFAGKADAPQEVVAPKADTTSVQGEPGAVAPPSEAAPGKPTAPKYKPPASWKPAAREKWGTLPEDLQETIAQREREFAQRINRAAEAEKRWARLEPLLGGQQLDAIEPDLRRALSWRQADATTRAAMIADMVAEGKVPVEALDTLLAQKLGNQPAAAPQAQQEFKDPRFDRFIAQMQQAQRAKLHSQVQAFAETHEFYPDVEETMAGLIEGGIAKGLDDAYNRALRLHPEIQEVLDQRKAAEAARTGQPAIERAQTAASSVRASPITASAPAPTDLRSQISAVMSRK